ncbi:helix-turn-helix transcriptional regulator [Streptomyces sp. NPDC005925]|uniref:helix-turn-helix domain-containing protein n=1 Tax=Streptomyces sp. NPDC005925 TaxID=3157172 RepID=UPI0033C8991F
MTAYELCTALPAAILERGAVRAALAAHDFGAVFAVAREQAGISYARIAAQCGIKPERVGALARGEGSVTTYEKIVRIADALRIPGHLVGLAPRPWEAAVGTRTDGGGAGCGTRRGFGAAAGAGLAAALSGLERPPAGRVGRDYPQRLRERTARLRRLDTVLGGGDTYKVYLGEYQATKALIRDTSHTEATGRALCSVLAEQAQQAGWAAFDAGREADAADLHRVSHRAAVEAGDMPLAGNALAFLAYQHLLRDPRGGLELAVRSVTEAGAGAPPGVRALLHTRLAWAHTAAGEPCAAERALDAAQAALTEIDGPQPDWATWVDETEVQVMAGRCWTEFQRPLRAVPVLEKAIGRYDDAHARDKSIYLSWLARSYLTAGEPEEAAVVVGRALELSADIASARPSAHLAPVLRQLDAHRAVAKVAEVLGRADVSGG